MPDDFDPYYQWLGISPKYQPPTHYRLLGLELFETNPDVISSAADQRMAHVRSLQTGGRGPLTQKILNELSTARRCLLNPASKAEYDAHLRLRRKPEAATAAAPPPPSLPAQEGWTKDLAADVKAASKFTALQAERLKIAQMKLPAAYRDLGNDVYVEGLFREDFAELLAQISAAEARLEQTKNSVRADGGLTSKVVSRVQLESAQRKFDALLAELGQAAYERHEGASGPPDLLAEIKQHQQRLHELDDEMQSLEQSRFEPPGGAQVAGRRGPGHWNDRSTQRRGRCAAKRLAAGPARRRRLLRISLFHAEVNARANTAHPRCATCRQTVHFFHWRCTTSLWDRSGLSTRRTKR